MLEQKLLIKYKNLITSQCSKCTNTQNLCTDCFKKITRAQKYIHCGIPLKYIDLELDIFTKIVDKNINIQTKRKNIYNFILDYIKNLPQNLMMGKGILLTGGFGTGKSTLSMNIAKAATQFTNKVCVREFSEMVKISQTGLSIDDSSPCDILQELVNNDIYCIENLDWVYSKNNSDYVKMFLDNIISLASKYSTVLIITSNMGIRDIKTEFNEHIYSVLHEICNIYNIPGSDVRQTNKRECL